MAEGQVFDRLAAELPEAERHDLFERLKEAVPHSMEPLAKAEDAEAILRKDELFQRQGFFSRLIVRIIAFFTQAKPEEVFGRRLLRQLRNSLELRFPALADYRDSFLNEDFLEEILRLKAAARHFYPAFEQGLDRDKSGFIAFLAGIDLVETESRLRIVCDPVAVSQEKPNLDEPALLKSVTDALDEAMGMVPDPERRSVYARVRNLSCLRKLVSFPFDRLAACFTTVGGRRSCPFGIAMPFLSDLADILNSMTEPISLELLEALFAFPLRNRLTEAEDALKTELVKAEDAVQEMRGFGERVPLVELLRLMASNLEYRPGILPAGEDWLPLYRNWWKAWIDARYNSFVQDRSRNKVMSDISEFLKGRSLLSLENLSPDGNEGKMPLRHDMLLRFALSAMEMTFPEEMNRPLKLILIEGQFYRQDNRLEYTDAYSRLIRIPELIHSLDKRLARDGDLGRQYEEAKSDLSIGSSMRQRRVITVQQAAAAEAESILGTLLSAARTGINLIRGILNPQGGSRYDSVQNLDAIDGRNNAAFKESLSRCKEKLERILTIILTLAEADSVKIPE